MRKSLATSILLGTLLLTGCASEKGKSEHAVKDPQDIKQYSLSDEFMIDDVKYKDLNQYKKERQQSISQEIEVFVKKEGYNEEGYNDQGFNRRGYNRNQVNKQGFSEDGYNLNNINEQGFNREGIASTFTAPFDQFGYAANGYDINGYDKLGYDRNGYNLDGFNDLGQSKNKNELSINEYIMRDWNEITPNEIFEAELYYPAIEKMMENSDELRTKYYEESMHPFSEEAYYINMICNSTPSLMQNLLPTIRLDAVENLKIKKPVNQDSQYILQSTNREFIRILNSKELLPQRLESSWEQLKQLKEGESIDLEDEEGYLNAYKLIEVKNLNNVEQSYVDFARKAIKDSKAKWGNAKILFDEIVYKAMDQQFNDLTLNKEILAEFNKASQTEWPKDYLKSTNEEIEGFNDESREEFIEALMTDIEEYEQSPK